MRHMKDVIDMGAHKVRLDEPISDKSYCHRPEQHLEPSPLPAQNALSLEILKMAYKTHDGFGTPQALMEYCAGLMASASGAEEARSVLDAERDVVDLAHLDRMIDKLMVYREPI